jgi:23S rRNA G2445 N2-methylase RlmL
MLDVIVTCARATSAALAHELAALGAEAILAHDAAVSCRGDWGLVARANVWLRCGSRVLVRLAAHDGVVDEDAAVAALERVTFEDWLDGKGTFCVDAHTGRETPWAHTLYASQRTKDVVVDRLRRLGRGRPSVDTVRPHVRFVLSWSRGRLELSVDTSGDPLHRRGYRGGVTGRAPLRETLAAALLATAHADVDRPFLDPCCGTGTLAIEQAWRALRRAPGRDRRFGFERWSHRSPELDRALANARTEARDLERRALPAPIHASDWHPEAIEAVTTCVAAAGLSSHVRIERVDARAAAMPGERPVVCANLPFGERLGDNRLQLDGFYRTLGAHLRGLDGARLILFSAHEHARRLLDLDAVAVGKPRHWRFSAGDLDAWLMRWDLPYSGYRAAPRAAEKDPQVAGTAASGDDGALTEAPSSAPATNDADP